MSRMLKWFLFTGFFGLLPFGFSVLFKSLREPHGVLESSPELLFFSIVVSAAGVAELVGNMPEHGWKKVLLAAGGAVLLAGAVISASLYGVYVDHTFNTPGRELGLNCSLFDPQENLHGRVGGLTADSLRASVRTIAEDCREWMDFQRRVFKLSIWLALALGFVGTVCEWHRFERKGGG
ncbi:MAG TPA: hypothetical protein VHG08_16835 [Longimicrobium sp.]|nr:hypothetical protein [Longimicrobium sp.]